jgi:hypothetical protein
MQGLLADVFGLTSAEVKAKGQMIRETYVKRLQSHPRPYTSKSTQELLQIANENTIKNTGLDFWDAQVVPKTLLHDPATDADIEALELRLEVTLPDDYNEFLRITNGFGSGDQGIFTGVFPDPAIHSTEHIKWIDTDESLPIPVQLCSLPPEIESLVEIEDDTWNSPHALTAKIIELGERDIEAIWLIPPETTKAAIAVYRHIYEAANTEQKVVVDRAVEVFAGSWEELEKLQWCCLSADLENCGWNWFTSFRQYLERSAWRSGKVYTG